MTNRKLNIILKEHSIWLNDHQTGERANLSGVDLSRTDLSGVNLSEADLSGATLIGATLIKTNLSGADLTGTNFKNANLASANLSGANLTKTQFHGAILTAANLHEANLSGANLSGANLVEAWLSRANLTAAYLYETNLGRANLSGANFNMAYLSEANLNGANISEARKLWMPQACPEEGQFICYKKACIYTKSYIFPDDYKIVKLLVPENAKRSSGTTRKCRCSEALVLDILNFDGTEANVDRVESMRDSSFVYEIGKTVSVENFDENRWHECAPGIHFFMNMIDAINY